MKRGHLVEVQRDDLVDRFIGGTSKNTVLKIKEAKGGVLFIDEAYRLSNDTSGRDYGKEAIETLMSVMTNPDCPVMIFAGYQKEMQQFVKVNAGLQRRIKNKFVFTDFTVDDLVKITMKQLESRFPRLPPLNTAKHLVECFSKLPKNIISLNNAALCNDLVEEVHFAQEARLSKHCSLADLRKFTEEDLAKSINTF